MKSEKGIAIAGSALILGILAVMVLVVLFVFIQELIIGTFFILLGIALVSFAVLGFFRSKNSPGLLGFTMKLPGDIAAVMVVFGLVLILFSGQITQQLAFVNLHPQSWGSGSLEFSERNVTSQHSGGVLKYGAFSINPDSIENSLPISYSIESEIEFSRLVARSGKANAYSRFSILQQPTYAEFQYPSNEKIVQKLEYSEGTGWLVGHNDLYYTLKADLHETDLVTFNRIGLEGTKKYIYFELNGSSNKIDITGWEKVFIGHSIGYSSEDTFGAPSGAVTVSLKSNVSSAVAPTPVPTVSPTSVPPTPTPVPQPPEPDTNLLLIGIGGVIALFLALLFVPKKWLGGKRK